MPTIAPAPCGPLQPHFDALLHDVCASLATQAGHLLDGIYLYGSIARGDATPGVSDLDLTLVLRQPPTPPQGEALETLRQALQTRHPEVLKIDFDIGYRAQVLATEHLYSWGYWLKHQCRCLCGNDLALHFAPFPPSRAIALAVNGDFAQVLDAYARRLDDAREPAALRRRCANLRGGWRNNRRARRPAPRSTADCPPQTPPGARAASWRRSPAALNRQSAAASVTRLPRPTTVLIRAMLWWSLFLQRNAHARSRFPYR
ncbi:DNA polymerase III subunit beta [Janthinobacterium sp. ROICE36]|uniref:nucleotidyltransferase domain-containing protein n=1 Tax=Janthinobacterium sp. ROICE36 TaxID=2048670 RepID=UPI000C7F2011|nr:nucleotidyltransferase domain-containing protein [Janthinobacterium sp. ROICE36]PLY40569.1 DNA polymerase III subunit beta [Janthinobacterium sp. ROICE36]